MHEQGWILSAFPIGYFSSQVWNFSFVYKSSKYFMPTGFFFKLRSLEEVVLNVSAEKMF